MNTAETPRAADVRVIEAEPTIDRPRAMSDRPTVEPETRPWVQQRETRVGMPAASVDLDPAVLGPLPGQPTPPLYREGDFVVDRLGELRELPNGATAFVFVDEADSNEAAGDKAGDPSGARVMILQPSQRLETMLSAAEQQAGNATPRFRLSGQVHVYRGVNYLMPTELRGYQAAPIAAEDADDPAAGAEDAPPRNIGNLPDAAADLDAPAPVEVGSSERIGAGDTFGAEPGESLMSEMAAELDALLDAESGAGGGPTRSSANYGGISAPLDPSRVRQAPAAPRPGGGGTGARALGDGPLVREGEFVLSRAGRMVRSADRRDVLFAFEADGPELAEPPMGILPSRLRMWMEDAVAAQGDSAVFVISGRVFQFRGANYVLPTVVKRRIESDNLGG